MLPLAQAFRAGALLAASPAIRTGSGIGPTNVGSGTAGVGTGGGAVWAAV